MSPHDGTRPPSNNSSESGLSLCPENEQIDPARNVAIGVGFPLPVISPANAGPAIAQTNATARAPPASALLIPCPSLVSFRHYNRRWRDPATLPVGLPLSVRSRHV